MFITSYYFRAHTYTLVPKHVREDMEWMASCGTDAVCIGILEQDLYAAVENIEWICSEADRVGMKVFATPSRWGSIVAGCPKVPSIFSSRNLDAMVRDADGSIHIGPLGPVASVHHPATFEFYKDSLAEMFKLFPISGIIWDEVKNLDLKDYSESAKAVLRGQDIEDGKIHAGASADFFDRVGAEAVRINPDILIGMFLYGNLTGFNVELFAGIKNLHDFGCDGKPYRSSDGGSCNGGKTPATKLLCESGGYFVEQAKKHDKRPLFLIENHAMTDNDVEIMDSRLPEVLSLGAEHILYYYFPRCLKNPDKNMAVVARHIRRAKGKK